jgi:hypothetical protein
MYQNTHAPGRKCPASKSDATTRRADDALANQPFNDSDWFCKNDDVRWQPSGARQIAKGNPQGERGGVHQFGVPSCVVRCLVEMLAPYTALRGSALLQSEALPRVVSAAKDNGRTYDPACGSGGSLPASRLSGVRFAKNDRGIAQGIVQSEKFVESHGGKIGDISIYGQDKWARRQRPFGLAKRARRVRLRRQQPKQSNATTRGLATLRDALLPELSSGVLSVSNYDPEL